MTKGVNNVTKREILDSYLDELSSYICTQLREQNPTFNQRREKVGELEDSLRTRVEQLDPDLWEQIEDYVAAVDSIAGEEIKAAYLHGAADFARVMAKTE